MSETKSKSWGDIFKEVGQSAMGVLIENERETPARSAPPSASASQYSQGPANVSSTSVALEQSKTGGLLDWVKTNWLLVLVGVLLIIALLLFVVGVF